MTRFLRLLHRSESGMALVVVLIVALAVALVGVAMADNVVRETQIAGNESSAVQARYLAEAGIVDAAAHLSQDNTWQGPITQSVGPGSYTVKVDPNVSQLGALGAVKSVLSTGTVGYRGLGSATQTVRVTLLVLPQAFSKATMVNTVFTLSSTSANGATPTVQNTVLRQLGTIHANNLQTKTTSVSQGAGTVITSTVTANSGTISLLGTCIACAPTNTAPVIPLPTFDWTHYITLAQQNPSACPGFSSKTYSNSPPLATGAGTYFTVQGDFDGCVTAITADAQGFRTLNGIIFLNFDPVSLPNIAQEAFLKINGTLAAYLLNTSGNTCVSPTVCGSIVFNVPSSKFPTIDMIFTAQKGEPAIMVGGNLVTGGANCNTSASPGTIAITGLVYMLNTTLDPSKLITSPGYCVNGSSTTPVTLTGMLVGNIVGTPGFSSNSLTYDPSSFFPGLPSGLNAPVGPFVILPLSWSSGN